MMPILYGIPNCDTVKKSRAWLDGRGVAYTFHDYKKLGIRADKLADWCERAGWEKVLNRSGSTFKKLPDEDKAGLDQANGIRLMSAQPSMIKRPIVEHAGGLLIGFNGSEWQSAF